MRVALITAESKLQIMKIKQKYPSKRLASLLYSADKSANTVGDYDAYIKGHDISDTFIFDLITPYKTKKSQIAIISSLTS